MKNGTPYSRQKYPTFTKRLAIALSKLNFHKSNKTLREKKT